MKYNIEITENFKKEAKRLIKKYASLRAEIEELGILLSNNPLSGIPLGYDVYKMRLGISSKNKGKSGGARIIYFVKVIGTTVYLLSIYSKSEKPDITDKEIKDLMNRYL
jgi:mRNA-degrading endonuclease RelE of RelBE toxin-antitoxin system